MRDFARLYDVLDQTTKTSTKVAALVEYFKVAEAEDLAWAVYFLTGRKLPSAANRTVMASTAMAIADLPDWLFQESYTAVGDLAETMAKILPEGGEQSGEGLSFWAHQVQALAHLPEDQKPNQLRRHWSELPPSSRFVFNKLLTGNFRVGVSQELVLRGLSEAFEIPKATVAHRLTGKWKPSPNFLAWLQQAPDTDTDQSKPFPFCLAHPLPGEVADLGHPSEWLAEWKWDGVRCQLVRRGGKVYVWSRGEDIVNDSFPEIAAIGDLLPDGTVIDGEAIAWSEGKALPFQSLQRRLGRKAPGKKLLGEVPLSLIAFDVLELGGRDVREMPFAERREALEQLIADTHQDNLILSESLVFSDWAELAVKREHSAQLRAEGLMLKRKDSNYETGRKRGAWWKWKVEPFTVDAVLVYAQRGSGKRASLYTDYTFALWKGEELVPFAKAYSGLTDAEIQKVDSFVRRNTQERFGPVRTVTPQLVFEIAFEGIQISSRHKSGIAVRFPRIARWRHDKAIGDADKLEDVRSMLESR